MTFLTTLFALYLIIPGSNIIEIGRFKNEAACATARSAMNAGRVTTFCMRTERDE